MKRIEDLTVADLESFPVWQFANDSEEQGETIVRPIKKVPVANLNGRVVGTKVTLSNGERLWALIGNVNSDNARLTRHFLTLSIMTGDRWFTMARYHDFDAEKRGPKALAAFVGKPIDQIFPISYNISRFCKGDPAALASMIEKEPAERMTRAQIIALAVP